MAAYLLAWNPEQTEWDSFTEDVNSFRRGKALILTWSCSNTNSIRVGDRVWFIYLGKEPRGIFACGTVTKGSYEGRHWKDRRKTTRYVDFQIDWIAKPGRDQIIPRSRLKNPPFGKMHWNTRRSGIRIPDEVASALEQEWLRLIGGERFILPEEVSPSGTYIEGARRLVLVNSYERNPRARAACIAHYGARCVVCGFSFAEKYGPLGEGLIHVHHLVPLSEIGESYELDPIKDLRPVCPNCHAMIHARVPPYSIEEVEQMIRAQRSGRRER